jgi:hypothetical protein
MRKIQLLGVVLLALFAFGVLTAASASAAFLLAEWLVNGVAVTTELVVESTGEVLLEDNKVPLIGKAVILCSGISVGWVGPNSLGWISEVLSLNGEAISTTPLVGLSLDCVAQAGCETNTAVLVWPVGLPGTVEVELLEQEGGPFFVGLAKSANGAVGGWEIQNCLVLGASQEDECTASEGAAQLTLEGTTLLGSVSEAFTQLTQLTNATCKVGGINSGIVEGSAALVPSGGGELTASSETAVS